MQNIINKLIFIHFCLISGEITTAEHELNKLICELQNIEEENIQNIWDFERICLNQDKLHF